MTILSVILDSRLTIHLSDAKLCFRLLQKVIGFNHSLDVISEIINVRDAAPVSIVSK